MNTRKNLRKSVQRFALCLYFFSIHFENWDIFSIGIDFLITKITIVFYILFSFPNFKRFKSLKKFKKFIFPIILVFMIQTFSGYNYKRLYFEEYFSLVFFLNIILFILMLIQAQYDDKAIGVALKSYAFGGLILALFFVLGIQTNTSFGGRTTIFDVNHNMLAVNLSIVALIFLNLLLFNKKTNEFVRFIYLSSILIIVIFIASTGSRSGVLSLLGGALMIFLLIKTKDIFKKIMVIVIGGLFTFFFLIFIFNYSISGNRLNETVQTGDLSGRNDYWVEMIPLSSINPAFGIGYSGFKYEVYNIYGEYRSAHNVFVSVLVTGGFVSLLLVCFFLYNILKKANLNYKTKNDILSIAFLVPIFVMAFVAHLLSTKIEWGVFAYIISVKYRNRNDIKYLKNHNFNSKIFKK